MKIMFVMVLGMLVGFLTRSFPQVSGQFHKHLTTGKSTQIDLCLSDYYKNRSASSIASEIEVNGFDCVHYIVVDDAAINLDVINELHRRNIGVWGCVFATSVYGPRNFIPPQHTDWLMKFVNQEQQGYTHISFIHDSYRNAMKERLVRLFRKYPFDGFVFMETHFPVLGDINNPAASFGDISPAFQAKFKQDTGNIHFPNFSDPADPHYYKTVPQLFKELVQYRIKVVNDFSHDIINGKNGLRKNFPNLLIGTWSMAISRPDALEFLKTWEGQDAVSMVKLVQPDVHFFQTHWPDWVKPELPPDYIQQYRPFVLAVKNASPDIHVGVQGDIGSIDIMRKTPLWYENFVQSAGKAGFDTTTIYEFILRWQIYHCPPELKQSIMIDSSSIHLIFDKRIDPDSVRHMIGKSIIDFAENSKAVIKNAVVDGNIVMINVDKPLKAGNMLSYPVGSVCDVPCVRFPRNPNGTTDAEKFGVAHAIPEGSFSRARLEPISMNTK